MLRIPRIAAWFACLLFIGPSAYAAENSMPRPNIVLIVADDLGYADCGFNGGREIKTPSIDRLAAAGSVLEAFYVQPVCTPTRAALLTGRYPMRLGLQVGVVRPWAKYGLGLEERTLANGLQEAGYRTAITGKWHLGSFDKAYWPNNRGFDHAYGHLFGALDYFTHQRDGELDWFRNGEPLKEVGYTTHLIAKEAVDFVKAQNESQPFFLYVPFNAVHTPLQVPDIYKEPYRALPEPRRSVAGMLAAMDEAIGQIVSAVEEKELRENTLFIFSADNGGFNPGKATDNTPFRGGKGSLYEGGVRAAAFATWDGHIPEGKRVSEFLHAVDLYPTLLNLAGASLEQPESLDGLDAWKTIAHGAPSPRNEVLLNTTPSVGAIRVSDWKLIVRRDDQNRSKNKKKRGQQAPAVELFNLRDDISEKNNLAEQHPEKVAELQERYEKYAGAAVEPKNSRE